MGRIILIRARLCTNTARAHKSPLLSFHVCNNRYLFDATTAAAGETATEICAADLGSLDDDDMPAALPAGWVNPSAAGATGRVRDEDALQDSIRVRAMPTTPMAPHSVHAVRFRSRSSTTSNRG